MVDEIEFECPGCATVLHRECFVENGRCTTRGCSGGAGRCAAGGVERARIAAPMTASRRFVIGAFLAWPIVVLALFAAGQANAGAAVLCGGPFLVAVIAVLAPFART